MLNRDVKQYGKKYMFDGNEETCWNSDQVNYICSLYLQFANVYNVISPHRSIMNNNLFRTAALEYPFNGLDSLKSEIFQQKSLMFSLMFLELIHSLPQFNSSYFLYLIV